MSKGLVDKIEVTVRHRESSFDTRALVHLALNSQIEKELVNQSMFTNESSTAFTKEIGDSVQSNMTDFPDVNVCIGNIFELNKKNHILGFIFRKNCFSSSAVLMHLNEI